MKTLKRVLGAAMVLALLFTCVGVASGGALRDDAGKTVSESAQAPAEPAPAEPISAPAAEDTPAGGQDAEEAGGGQDAEEAGGGQETKELADGQDAEEAGGGQDAEEPAAGDKAALMSVSEPLPIANVTIDDDNIEWENADGPFTYTGRAITGVTAKLKDSSGYTKPEGDITYTGTLADGNEYQDYNNAPKDAGTYTVTATWQTDSGDTATAEKTIVINPYELKVTTRIGGSSNIPYDGQKHTVSELSCTVDAITLVNSEGTIAPNAVLMSDDDPLPDGAVNAGTYKVGYDSKSIAWNNAKASNYNLVYESQAELTITPKALAQAEVTFENSSVEYNGEEQEQKPTVKDGTAKLTEGQDYTLSYAPEDHPINAGTVEVTVNFINNYSGTQTESYEITPKEVTVTAKGQKPFGAKDAEVATAETTDTPKDASWYQVQITGLAENDAGRGKDLFTVVPERETGEMPGTYDITLAITLAENGNANGVSNYKVKDMVPDSALTGTLTVDDGFVITDEAAFTVRIDDDNDPSTEYKITTHDYTVNYVIEPADGLEAAGLLENLQDYVDISLVVDKTDAVLTYVVPDEGNEVNIPAAIDQVAVTDLMAKEGSFAIPAVNYVSGDMTWTAGLPTGTVLKAKVVSNDSEHAYAGESVNSLTVEDVPGGMVVECVPDGENTADGPDGSTLMNANGVVTIKPAEGALVGPEDWVRLTTGGVAHYYKADGFALGAGTMDATGTLQLSLSDLQTLAGGSAWYGDNPTQGLTITAQAVDDVNHNIESDSDTQSAAFDTAAVADTPQSIENRAESVTIVLAEKVKENTVTVAGNFGGSTPTITSNNTETLTWENVTEWKNYPETLPHSGDVITITYKDMVGNEGTHVMNVVKSAAVVSNTLFVQPITDGTVPAKALRFYGDTNVWEQGYLTVGGTTFTVSPIPGGSPYSNSETQWQQVVTLSDINFPVGTPTTVSMAYDDLLGGDAAISITYKNEAQTPVMGSEAVVGSEALWGYVESGATVSAAVYHADGTVTQVPQSNIAVDQFGYFYIRLDQPLASGDQVVISTSDFCGNQKSITLSVQAELKSGAKAELLGANIVGKLMTDQQTYHRFATPVDLGALNAAENKSMTLPILAYKGIEIGKMTISLNSQGKMDLKYSITAGSYIPQGAHASLNTYTVKPDINALVLDEHPVVVKDLKTALNGSMPSVDVSGYQNADGGYGGVIWLQAQFDIDMTEDNYTSRGGRDVRFYRWLTESLQTEDVLGAVYQETLAYDENMTYYSTYQRFESISRQF